MSLLVLMYHRARAGRHGNSVEMLDAHFAHIAAHHPTALPGDKLTEGHLNVTLSFDDGYFDFYAHVFPLLVKHNLRALLAIPPAFIREKVETTAGERLKLEIDEAFAQPERGGFCTWRELEELTASGRVVMAAHGLTHQRLDRPGVDLADEIEAPRTTLTTHLAKPTSFVFPFGRFSRRALQRARQSYPFVFRIGGALNCNWNGRLLYRVDADEMASPSAVFAPARLTRYRVRRWWNRLRLQ